MRWMSKRYCDEASKGVIYFPMEVFDFWTTKEVSFFSSVSVWGFIIKDKDLIPEPHAPTRGATQQD